ncbi:hypothetical protein E2C01_047946 [Portunus trituberculatus]|uniref:Uncharacterized protein n=1 Tax=Portunus trituberculatus TaxID=210409 RepID=A0A5B7G935_PORTR|nr:hypothetical protein [Portunus trituberculatus]
MHQQATSLEQSRARERDETAWADSGRGWSGTSWNVSLLWVDKKNYRDCVVLTVIAEVSDVTGCDVAVPLPLEKFPASLFQGPVHDGDSLRHLELREGKIRECLCTMRQNWMALPRRVPSRRETICLHYAVMASVYRVASVISIYFYVIAWYTCVVEENNVRIDEAYDH